SPRLRNDHLATPPEPSAARLAGSPVRFAPRPIASSRLPRPRPTTPVPGRGSECDQTKNWNLSPLPRPGKRAHRQPFRPVVRQPSNASDHAWRRPSLVRRNCVSQLEESSHGRVLELEIRTTNISPGPWPEKRVPPGQLPPVVGGTGRSDR